MRLLEPTAQIWMKIDPYYQQQKCRTTTLVSGNIRCMGIFAYIAYYQWQKCRPMSNCSFWKYKVHAMMRIFAGVPMGAGVKRHWGLSKTAILGYLAGYVFKNARDTASNIIWRYATPCRLVTDCKMNDLKWPWVAISCQNPFSANTSWSRAFKCQNIIQPLRFCGVLCIARSVIQPIGRHAQLTRCFSAVAELLVLLLI